MSPTTYRRSYDHRVREAICRTGDIRLLPELEIPPSTARSWLTRGARDVVTSERLSQDRADLVIRVAQLEQTLQRLRDALRLLLTLLRVLGVRRALLRRRIADGPARQRLLRAIDHARQTLGLSRSLRLLGLSASRYHAWRRRPCEASHTGHCRRRHARGLTDEELATMQQMATDPAYRHVPTGTLARLAARLGRVVAAPATWYRLLCARGWQRPRRRRHPEKPRTGIRARRPDEVWHMDVTVLRLLDGTRVYLHAIIDNFSRRILAWRLVGELAGTTAAELLHEAAGAAVGRGTRLMTDAGSENFNAAVDAALRDTRVQHVLAQVHVTFSNSMIERFWTSLRHGWLYLNVLDTLPSVRRLVAFFVQQHNQVLPHSAFQGQTPDEMYRGTGAHIPGQLAAAKAEALSKRMEANRAISCDDCPITPK